MTNITVTETDLSRHLWDISELAKSRLAVKDNQDYERRFLKTFLVPLEKPKDTDYGQG